MDAVKQDQGLKCEHCGKMFTSREEQRKHESIALILVGNKR